MIGVGKYLTKSKTLIRKHTVKHGVDRSVMIHYGDSLTGGVPNSFYALLEYDSLPVNVFDSLGQHTCDCKSSAGIGKLTHTQTVVISPNPVINNQFTIQSALPVASVELVSVVGQSVYFHNYSSRLRDVKVMLNNLTEGVYFVRVTFGDDQPVVKKIVIQ